MILDNQQAAQTTLDDLLSQPSEYNPIPGKVLSRSEIMGIEESDELSDDIEQAETTQEPELQDEALEETEEETTELSDFATQFEENFGVPLDEAKETIAQIQNFRDEMVLMGKWNVTPSEYASRIGQVKEFYQTLPEEQREKFNTVEGAEVIWNHLQKNQPKAATKKTSSPGSSKSVKRTAKPTYTSAQIAKMPPAEYNAKKSDIMAAFREGRVK